MGFAGGRTLRCVAARLAKLLAEPHIHNPRVLYLHAMVAAFDDEDFYADPNSFITYFIGDNVSVDVKFKRLPLPGIVESDRFEIVRQLAAVDDVYRDVGKLQIIVTSGSMWSDEYSTLREYFEAAKRLKIGDAAAEAADLSAAIDNHNVIGDMLWQPINSEGPVEIKLPFTIPTLMRLRDLPKFIGDGGRVLLVMGCSGVTRMPKSKLLKAILDLPAEHRLCTHLVTDTPTVRGMFQ